MPLHLPFFRTRRDRGRTRLAKRCPRFEPLTDRRPLAGDLEILSAELINFQEQPMTAPVVGEQVFLRAEWREVGTPSGMYSVRFAVNGVVQDSARFTASPGNFLSSGKGLGTINVAGRTSGVTFAMRGGWFVGSGEHTVSVIIDDDNAVAESSEENNALQFTFTTSLPTDLPSKLEWPLGGEQNSTWSCCNYVDVDNLPGTARDYRGNAFALDGHAGYDMGGVSFARMDQGIPVFASAAGTVSSIEDGHFDRVGSGQLSSDRKANQLVIDHGHGWSTAYGHLANGLTVSLGDRVTPGQLLGYLGSSGGSNVPHLHWELRHFDGLVEPGFAPSTFFTDPRPYQSDSPTGIKDAGLTNVGQGANERFSDIDSIPRGAAGTITSWTTYSHVRAGDVMTTKWIRPDGTLRNTSETTFPDNTFGGTFFGVLSIGFFDASGPWHWVREINGVEASRVSFSVVDEQGSPEVRLSQGILEILDERTTPLDFGSVSQVGISPRKTFTIHNHGYALLEVSNPVMPPGFALVGEFPAAITPGQSAEFTVQLDAAIPGTKFGEIHFNTNDESEDLFNFNVSGLVIGANEAGRPQLTLPGPAVGYAFGQSPVLIDHRATLVQSDSDGIGSLVVEFAGGGTGNDRLGIRSVGDGPGQISVHGDELRFEGMSIGRKSGGSAAPLAVTFNRAATRSAIEALVRSIEYSNVSASPSSRPRYIRFTVTDTSGDPSNQPIKKVMLASFEPNIAPRVTEAIAGLTAHEDSPFVFAFPEAIFSDENTFDSELTYTARRQDGRELPPWLSFDPPSRRFHGTPGNADVGEVSITVAASDLAGYFVATDFRVEVVNTNDPPLLSKSIPDRQATQDEPFRFVIDGDTFQDADAGDALVLSATTSTGAAFPIWLTFHSATRTFSGTPANTDVGVIEIVVTATDNHRASANGRFEIDVADVNDAPTHISLSNRGVEENRAGAVIGSVIVSDPDVGDTHIITVSDSRFEVASGWLRLKTGVSLDYEREPSIPIVIRASDGGQPSLHIERAFTIAVGDINEFAPQINGASFGLPENSRAGTTVGTIDFSDGDQLQVVDLAIMAGNLDSTFELTSDGQIRVSQPERLDFETTSGFELTVVATDSGTPPRSASATISIQLSDVNEFAPVLEDQTFHVAEDAESAGPVGKVSAQDEDVYQGLTYRILSGNIGNAFVLNPQTGQLTVADPTWLAHQTHPVYSLVIRVDDDAAPAKSGEAVVTINVDDVGGLEKLRGAEEDDHFVTRLPADHTLVVASGPGDDTIEVDAVHPITFAIDGEEGIDTVEFQRLPSIVLSELPDESLVSIERLRLGTGAQRLELAAADVVRVTDADNTLSLQYGIEDSLHTLGAWNALTPGFKNGRYVHRFSGGDATLEIINDRPWQNPILLHDVNRDQLITARDALTVINRIARHATTILTEPKSASDVTSYYDVTGDGEVTALDALRVINHLGRIANETAPRMPTPRAASAMMNPISPFIPYGDDESRPRDEIFRDWIETSE